MEPALLGGPTDQGGQQDPGTTTSQPFQHEADAVTRMDDAEIMVNEAAEAVKQHGNQVARGFTLAGWCRFATTARRVGHQACCVSGGNTDLLSLWQQCRDARAQPAVAAARAVADITGPLDQDQDAVRGVVEACCGDSRCLARVLQSASEEAASAVWRAAGKRFLQPTVKKHR